jgi:hypothetical protein
MAQFALVSGDTVIELSVVAFPVNPAFTWAPVGSTTPSVGWTVIGGGDAETSFIAPAAPAPVTRPSARAALDASDVTILRCVESGVAVPTDWVAYRKALRAIVSGSEMNTPLPPPPPYPPGT